MARGAVRVVSINGALTVTFTAGSGATPTVFSDEACTTTTALPATVADGATNTFYFASPGAYNLSVKTASGVQIAADLNTTKVVTVDSGDVGVYAYDARLVAKDFSGDSGRHSPNTDLAGTYPTLVNASGYGAKGDGVADDGAAIQAALNAAAANPVAGQAGGLCYLPAGTYLTSQQIVVPRQVRLVGAGASNTKIQADDSRAFPINTPVVRLGSATDVAAIFSTTVEHLTIWCNKVAAIAGSIGVYSSEANELCGVFDVAVGAFTDAGIVFERIAAQDPPADVSIERVYLQCDASGAVDGIRLSNISGEGLVRTVSTVPLVGGSYSDAGLKVTKCGSLTISGFHPEHCANGIRVGDDAASAGTIIGVSGHPTNTTLVHLGAASGNWTALGIKNGGEATTLQDDFTGITKTDSYIGLYQQAGQVVATTQGQADIFLPALGMKAWNFDPTNNAGGVAPTQGTIYACALPLRAGMSLTKAMVTIGTAAAGTAPTGMFVGICDSTGKMVAQSANVASDAGWTVANAIKGFALSATYIVPTSGLYYVVVLQVGAFGTTQPTLLRGSGIAPPGTAARYLTGGTGQTGLPANGSSLTLVGTAATNYAVAVG